MPMTRPLSLVIQGELRKADDSPAWEDEAFRDRNRMMAEALRDAYPMADIRLAQFLMETAMGLQTEVLSGPDEGLRERARAYQVSLVMLASAVSRKVRGKPEI